jgi:hypothetical protein
MYPMGFPTKPSSWKGKTFVQVIASIQKNAKNAPTLSVHQLRKALPLSIYRKEIHNVSNQTLPKNCNPRISTKLADFETPGNTIVSETAKTYSNGLVNTLDINLTTISSENGGCNTPNNCFSPQKDARRRCRSSGMIPRKFNVNKNNDTYCTSTQQYLTARNRTVKQNEYNFIRKGNSGIIPGPGLAASNVYSPGGLSHCYQPMISAANNNNIFTYVWVDGTSYTVTIPDGMYDITALNGVLQTAQLQNKTYFKGVNGINSYLLTISYDNNTNQVVLIANVASQASYPTSSYSAPSGASWSMAGLPLTDPTPTQAYPAVSGATYFIILQNNTFSEIIGFAPGAYFAGIIKSAFKGSIFSNYVALYYKPNNPEFGVQGAVDASTRLQRLKYDTITNGAASLRTAYGNAAANALAYGVSEQAYTVKTQVGDKYTYTPVINPKTGKICPKQFIYRG